MKYLLTQEEIENLVSIKVLNETKEALLITRKAFRNSEACTKAANFGYCDKCPIGSLKSGFYPIKICPDQEYSK